MIGFVFVLVKFCPEWIVKIMVLWWQVVCFVLVKQLLGSIGVWGLYQEEFLFSGHHAGNKYSLAFLFFIFIIFISFFRASLSCFTFG